MALKAALRRIEIFDRIRPQVFTFFMTLELVIIELSEIRCCGMNKGDHKCFGRCMKPVAQEDLARALLGLQTCALDYNMSSEEIRDGLLDVAARMLHKGLHRDQQAKELAGKLSTLVLEFRDNARFNVGTTNYRSETTRISDYAYVISEWRAAMSSSNHWIAVDQDVVMVDGF
ncbi:hypothetical protein LTR37_004308 [Vermiconidia calcicola]|uniref:Uncharacterized protein n=1 Tax=Vermiconidia calcicola TaxID=1690605 RepID=A0ACC3NMX1_9PEZI|nr:hypothetical protein LTR37_004308 [Vermiconidia calcicola]